MSAWPGRKRKAIPVVPVVNECPVCTTPSRCERPESSGKRGAKCIGRDDGPDQCDCINLCGDDPWIAKGKATPCSTYHGKR